MHIILQYSNTAEARAVHMASMLSSEIAITTTHIDGLNHYQSGLKKGAIPVGSVQFLRLAMELTGITMPDNLSYAPGCVPYLKRQVRKVTAASALGMTGKWFMKSADTKVLTGFVLDTDWGETGLNEHDREQFGILCSLPPDAPIWVAEPVQWVSEYRYYVMESKVIGHARYDQNELEDVKAPDAEVVKRCIADLAISHPYALDMGVLASGETALVEVNDAWAIGLYGGAMRAQEYVQFLAARWSSLKNAK